MKKTLFLTAAIGLGSLSALGDAFTPQTIITIADGTTAMEDITLTDGVNYATACPTRVTTVKEALEQAQMATVAGSDSRHAVVKDGTGELIITGKENTVSLKSAFMVREGTVTISDGATVSNSLGTDGCNLSVSGYKAKLVLDGGHYTAKDAAHTVSSVAIGTLDGDGELTLTNDSTFYTKQTLFSGLGGALPMEEPADPKWSMTSHYGGTYACVDGTKNNNYYCYVSEEKGFSSSTGSNVLTGAAVINVLSGSRLEAGYGLYVGNTKLTLSGKGSTITTGTMPQGYNDNTKIGSLYGITAIVEITDGGVWNVTNGQYTLISRVAGQRSRVTIDGAGSALNAGGWVMIGDYDNVDLAHSSSSEILVTNGGKMTIGSGLYVHGAQISHSLTVEGKDSLLHTAGVTAESGIDIKVKQGASMNVDNTLQVGNQMAASLELESGAKASAKRLNLGTYGTMNIDADSALNLTGTTYHIVAGSLENNGTIKNDDAVLAVFGTLKGSGTFGATQVVSEGSLIVGNSPGKQTYTDFLLVQGIVDFSVDELLYPQPATDVTAGWDSGCYSVIDMQGHDLQLDGYVTITLSATAAAELVEVESFELVFAQNLGNTDYYTQTLLTALDAKTYIQFYGQSGYYRLNDAHFEIKGDDLVWVYGEKTPEPTTATLSLLALAGLVGRRRRH